MTAPIYDPTNVGNRPGDGPLRSGGVAPSRDLTPQAAQHLPSTMSKAASAMVEELELVRDVAGGPKRVRDAGPKYLPKAPGEDAENYRARLMRSVFFSMYQTAVDGLTGFVFRKDPVLGEDVPTPMVEHWENIDLAGTHGDVFLRDLMADAMVAGHAAILVDYPDTGGQLLSRGEEQAGGIRPYWVPIKKDDIVSWRETVENGQTLLDQVVIRECRTVPDGTYGEREQTQYRVLYRSEGVVGWRLEQVTDHQTVIVVAEGTYANQVEIPLAEVPTSGRTGRLMSRPTLADVAYLNVHHYQMHSDYVTSIHKTCVPIFTVSGGGEMNGPLVIGPNAAFAFSNPAASAAYVSHDGASLGACKAALDDTVRAIADLSLAMLASEKRAAETARAKEIDKGATDSKLAVTARGLQDATERALGFHARYLRFPSGGSIVINREFTDQTMPPELLTAYVGAIQNAGLPVRILTQAMQDGGLIGADEDLDLLDAEMEAAAAAKEEQARIDRETQMEAMQQSAPQAAPQGAPKPKPKTEAV